MDKTIIPGNKKRNGGHNGGCDKSKPLPPLSEKDIARFWSHVDRRGPEECWPWKNAKKYGVFWLAGENVTPSRVAYLLQKGEDAYPLLVRHSCDLPCCCNGKHLLKGTQKDNMADAMERGRTLTGDKNWMRQNPQKARELLDRINQYRREHPETSIASGERSGRRLHPEAYEGTKGAGHWTHTQRDKALRVCAKLTPEMVMEIRRSCHNNPRTNKTALAKQYGLAPLAVWKIVNLQTWKHLPP